MLLIIVISALLSIFPQNAVNAFGISIPGVGSWSLPNPLDLWDEINDEFNGVLDVFEEIVDTIPDLPAIIRNAIEFGECLANAAGASLDTQGTAYKDAKIAIENRVSEIKECKSSIIHSVASIISDNNKNAYLDLAKGFFNKCSGLNAGAITIEVGSGAAAIIGGSAAMGLAIDTTNGNVYAYTAGCGGISSDITAGGGYTLSLFNKFSDVAGCSKYYAIGFDINVLGVEGGMDMIAVYNLPNNDFIAKGIGFGVGVGLNPQNIENGYCFTFNPKQIINLNEFKKDDIINKIPALSPYVFDVDKQPIEVGKLVRFACGPQYLSWNTYGTKYIYHANFELHCWMDPFNTERPFDTWDQTLFTVHKALNGKEGQFSFESIDWPGYYIRHTARRFRIDPYDNNDVYKQDASFRAYNSLNDIEGEQSFETSNDDYRYNFMRTANDGSVWLNVWQDTSDYKEDISFVVEVYRE